MSRLPIFADGQHIMDLTGASFCAEILAAAASAERDYQIMADLADPAIIPPATLLAHHQSETVSQAPRCLSNHNWTQSLVTPRPARTSHQLSPQPLSQGSAGASVQGSDTSSVELPPPLRQHWTGSTWAYSLGSTLLSSCSSSGSSLQSSGALIVPNAVPATAEGCGWDKGGCTRTMRCMQREFEEAGDQEAWWQGILERNAARESRGAVTAPAVGGDGRPRDGLSSALGAVGQPHDEPASSGPVTALMEDVWATSLG